MDMRKHLRRWLNDAELVRLGGAYEGVIAGVVEELVRNRYTAQREVQPVIQFDDGWLLIPNNTMRAALMEMFGHESDDWTGRRVRVFRRAVERTNRTTGATQTQWVKTVMCPDVHARETPARRQLTVVATGREFADFDDGDEALAAGR